ncbi:MAG: UbiD family decarboxylase [Thermodesulfobacteriota bacterium]
MPYYRQLRDLIEALDQKGKLVRVSRPIIKETELMPLVRLQFRGLPEEERKGFLFDNVVSVSGKKYNASVSVGVLAASREIYALGMMCSADKIRERWTKALLNPIKPVLVDSAPCQEEVHMGKVLEREGLDELPIPVNTPGFTGTMRTTDSHVITKDIETGIPNSGCYQGKLLDRNIMALEMAPAHHGAIHWRKCQERGVPLHVAIVVGAPPNVAYASVAALPYGMDEFTVAGGISGEPLEMVKCKTVDLEVPAHAEIVIEGEVSVEQKVRAAMFGEFTGYMCIGGGQWNYLMRVTCITHRKRPLFNVIHSQMPPSESSKITQMALENAYYKHLLYDCNIPGILEVHFPESAGGRMMCVIRMKKRNPSEVWQALSAANAFSATFAKIIVVVDEDIDPRDPEAVNWAMTFRMQPHRDIHVMRGRAGGLDYSAYRPGAPSEERLYPEGLGASSLLIDATLRWPYPPLSLPKKEYMEHALEIWNELGLGPLKLKAPWYGYHLGYWTKDDEENAELIAKGDYRAVGKKLLEMEN